MKEQLYEFRKECTFAEGVSFAGTLSKKVNASVWRGREAGTCKVLCVTLPESKFGDQIIARIVVRYRRHGWKLRQVNRTSEGECLDGQGNALPEDHEKFVLEWDVDAAVDFNGLDFGNLLNEPD